MTDSSYDIKLLICWFTTAWTSGTIKDKVDVLWICAKLVTSIIYSSQNVKMLHVITNLSKFGAMVVWG